MASAAGRRRVSMSARTSIAAAARAAGIMRGAQDASAAFLVAVQRVAFASGQMSPAAPIGPDVARVDDPAVHTGELDAFSGFGVEVKSRDCSASHRGADVPVSTRRHRAQGLDRLHSANVGNSNRRASLRSPMTLPLVAPAVPLARRGIPVCRRGCTAQPPRRIGRRDNRYSHECIRADRRRPPGPRPIRLRLPRQLRSRSSRGFSCWSSWTTARAALVKWLRRSG